MRCRVGVGVVAAKRGEMTAPSSSYWSFAFGLERRRGQGSGRLDHAGPGTEHDLADEEAVCVSHFKLIMRFQLRCQYEPT
jgi:hypothetical protein